jgi:3-hydroxyisobutyrate dehydrogenase
MSAGGKPHAAVLGVGLMGSGMAASLLAAGFEVTVYNRSPEKAAALAEQGARVAGTPAEAAAKADYVIAMVADDDASRGVWLGSDGALGAVAPHAVAIESSTITPEWARTLADRAREAGVRFIDAPVTGSKAQAASGTLRFIVGGDADTVAAARPALEAMGNEVLPIGPAGSGALAKIINNFMCGVQVSTLAEALAMTERSGLDVPAMLRILTEGAPGSPLVKAVARRMDERDYLPTFFVSLMKKDLRYAIATFAAEGIRLATADAAMRRFEEAERAGHGEDDIAAVVEPLRVAD